MAIIISNALDERVINATAIRTGPNVGENNIETADLQFSVIGSCTGAKINGKVNRNMYKSWRASRKAKLASVYFSWKFLSKLGQCGVPSGFV